MLHISWKQNNAFYSQARQTVAAGLSFWHLFDKFLISLMASSCTAVHTNDLWNIEFQPVLQTQKTFPVRNIKFDQSFVGIKLILFIASWTWNNRLCETLFETLSNSDVWRQIMNVTVDTPPSIFQGIWPQLFKGRITLSTLWTTGAWLVV